MSTVLLTLAVAPLFWGLVLVCLWKLALWILPEERLKHIGCRLLLKAMAGPPPDFSKIGNQMAQQGMAADFLQAHAKYAEAVGAPVYVMPDFQNMTQDEMEKYRRETSTPEALELEGQLTSRYTGARVEKVMVQELPDGASSFAVVTDRGTLAFQAPILQYSDSSQEVPFAS